MSSSDKVVSTPSSWQHEFVKVTWHFVSRYALYLYAILALMGYTNTAIIGLLAYGAANSPKDYEEKTPIRGHEAADDSTTRSIRRHGSYLADLSGRNAPRPVSYFENSRGRRIYYRVMLPPRKEPPRSLVFLIHGYAAHFNRPTYAPLLQELLAEGIAVATIDLEGHGYSEGMRCYISSVDDLLADLEQYVALVQAGEAMLSTSDFFNIDPKMAEFNPLEAGLAASLARLPFFVGGQSLGGALALLLGHRINTRRMPYETWRGAVLLCPALAGNKPPAPVTAFLRYLVAPLFPTRRMPAFLDSTADNSVICASHPHSSNGI